MGKIVSYCCDSCGETVKSNDYWATVKFRSSQYLFDDGTEEQNYTWILCRECKVVLIQFMLKQKPERK